MHRVAHSYEVAAPPGAVFAFYASLKNLVRMAPPELGLRVVGGREPLAKGAEIVLATRPRFSPFEVEWLMRISEFEPGVLFADELVEGPFRRWSHRHAFAALPDGGTRVEDSIEFGEPLGIIARLMPVRAISESLERAFRHSEALVRRELESR